MPPSPRPSRGTHAARRLPFDAPVRAWALSEWALAPLRIFLGVTFAYAGMQKLANPNFFNPLSPISIQSQLIAAARTSPIHLILQHVEVVAKPVGLLIAFSEIAIGVGTLLGLWTRVAALGGLVLSLTLFLTVSFHASPYFTGADIVFFFAWIPFIVAGGGTRLSLDAWIANRVAKREAQPSPALVPIAFATVQALCGHYDDGACRAQGGLACDAGLCPVLVGGRAPLATRVSIDTMDRRALVLGGASAAAVATSVLLLGGAAADAGKMINNAPKPKASEQRTLSTTTTTTSPTTATTTPSGVATTTTTSPAGTLLGAASQVPVNHAASFSLPSSGEPGIVIHTDAGSFVAYNAVCPHMGCTVGYSSANQVIVCPCHGSEFAVGSGDVLVGPSPHGLEKLPVVEGPNGNLYLQ